MSAPCVFDRLAIDKLGTGPALGGTHDEHGPGGALGFAAFARRFLDGGDAVEHGVENCRSLLVHHGRVVAFEREGLVAVAAHEVLQLGMRNARQDRWVGDLVAVQMEDGQDGAVGGGVEKFVGVPACGERSGLGLAVAYHAGYDEIRIVKGSAIGMHERVAEFAALVDGAGRLGRNVAGNAVGPTELAEQPLEAVPVLFDMRVDFRV